MTPGQSLKIVLKHALPPALFEKLLSAYHFLLAGIGALLYRFPSRRLLVVGVTGTKGKSSVTEMINAILEEAGHRTALINSIRIKIGDKSMRNASGRSMPGRFFIQRFLRRALARKCTAAILEMTSEGARQHRHRFLDLNALVFTNLAPEHIESHGSYEEYADAKYSIGLQLVRSHKRPRLLVANADDPESARYLLLPVESAIPFSLSAQRPWTADERGGSFTFEGVQVPVQLPGEFSLRNALAAAMLARALGVHREVIARALDTLREIPGRAQRIEEGQAFTVVVDYAHTPDSLKALFEAYRSKRKICVVSATGGGRDKWKRPVMGKVASEQCDVVIVTNEDPYDEDPRAIAEEVADGAAKAVIEIDRRTAIRRALAEARPGDAVLITGKGTDSSIHGPAGSEIPWNDAAVVRDELKKVLQNKAQ
ncbi:MAG: UDP-N-acetylmuramyl-tripeptide synthetase [Candidatus Kaiserbacteria bacterium]|nr:MAG: UDP-N-acetylmuramyl-tripeptide synthetase [Candidatus Kaiserbacteria bacterium]